MLPERIPQLDVSIGDQAGAGQLLKASTYEFRYLNASAQQPSVALLMPAAAKLTWTDGDLFPPMDQNLPEGDLFMRIRAMFPKQPTTAMHLLALTGNNGIGRLGYSIPGANTASTAAPLSKEALLNTAYTPAVFNELVAAYLSTGAGIAGVQPKIMVPEARFSVPIPTLIVKAASEAYPGLTANEYLCLRAAMSSKPRRSTDESGFMTVSKRSRARGCATPSPTASTTAATSASPNCSNVYSCLRRTWTDSSRRWRSPSWSATAMPI